MARAPSGAMAAAAAAVMAAAGVMEELVAMAVAAAMEAVAAMATMLAMAAAVAMAVAVGLEAMAATATAVGSADMVAAAAAAAAAATASLEADSVEGTAEWAAMPLPDRRRPLAGQALGGDRRLATPAALAIPVRAAQALNRGTSHRRGTASCEWHLHLPCPARDRTWQGGRDRDGTRGH